jgi:integrase
MLVSAPELRRNAGMGRLKKRTRVTPHSNASSKITIRPHVDAKGYSSYLVQGWKEDGKWQRKQFKERVKAEEFAALKRVELANQGRQQRLMLCALTDEQHDEAVRAFDSLGSTYGLTEAVAFFLRHHRPPEFTIRLRDAINLYRDDRERDGVRPRSVKAILSVLKQFLAATDNPWAHEVTPQDIERFLRGVRAKNGTDKATRKTWNNYRNALHGFFEWAGIPDVASKRPYLFENPVSEIRKFTARQVREEQSAKPATTSPADLDRIFKVLARWRQGVMLKHFALLYFAGIRPEEVRRMKGREGELVNLATRTITIPANVSKTGHERHVQISDNLAAWLDAAPAPAVPKNLDRLAKSVRQHFNLKHDEPRHSFISYYVAVHRSIGDAALQAGNSESIVRRHYLNPHPREDGEAFFGVFPAGYPKSEPASEKEAGAAPKHLRLVGGG